MKEAQNVVKILATRSKKEAEALANCAEVNAISIQLNALVLVTIDYCQMRIILIIEIYYEIYYITA